MALERVPADIRRDGGVARMVCSLVTPHGYLEAKVLTISHIS